MVAAAKPFGYAIGATGAGNVRPSYPRSNEELVRLLEDPFPRKIVLTRDFDFRNREGVVYNGKGCELNRCQNAWTQNAIDRFNWCGSKPYVPVTFSQAGLGPINVGSRKTIIGLQKNGDRATIRGKGLRISRQSNVIIIGVHFSDINPHVVWGGDAIGIVGSDLIWIHSCKFTWIGRQMIVLGYETSRRVTISNNDFDGWTPWSASCNQQHYWVLLFLGLEDQITFANNWLHNTSGRGPKVGGGTKLHAYKNTFENIDGHAFDMSENSNVLIEGNKFKNVKFTRNPNSHTGGWNWYSCDGNPQDARWKLGRDCLKNSYQNSPAIGGSNVNILPKFSRSRPW